MTCAACGEEVDEVTNINLSQFLCDECFDVEREMAIEDLADE